MNNVGFTLHHMLCLSKQDCNSFNTMQNNYQQKHKHKPKTMAGVMLGTALRRNIHSKTNRPLHIARGMLTSQHGYPTCTGSNVQKQQWTPSTLWNLHLGKRYAFTQKKSKCDPRKSNMYHRTHICRQFIQSQVPPTQPRGMLTRPLGI